MALGKVRSLLVMAAVLVPLSAQADAAPPSPLAVYAIAAGETILLNWSPVPTPMAQYKVYGIVGGSTQYITTTVATATFVQGGGFTGFAVTSVVDGVESTPTYTGAGTCLRTDTSPPRLDTNCPNNGVYGTIRIPPLP